MDKVLYIFLCAQCGKELFSELRDPPDWEVGDTIHIQDRLCADCQRDYDETYERRHVNAG